jgi:hypothetical protein
MYEETEEEWEEDEEMKKISSFWSLATCSTNAYLACHVSQKKSHISFFVKLTVNFNVRDQSD